MAIVTQQSALDAIWEKVEANERLDLEDGLTLMESDDLLQLGELADTRPPSAGRHRRGLLRPEPVPEPDERLPCEVQVLRVRGHAEAGRRLHDHAEELVEDALATARAHRLHRDPHGERREPARRLRLLRGHDPLAPRGDAGRAPEVLHGERDPPHDEALGLSHEQVLVELKAAGLGRSRAAAPRSSPTECAG